MKFTCNTKPLNEVISLGIINANVSRFYEKSNIAQITASKGCLKINLEASNILSELTVKGGYDSEEPITIFVDSMMFKQLLSTIDTTTVELEFDESGLIVHSGKSKFTLPKKFDLDDISLNTPNIEGESEAIKLNKEDWKFIKDHQMYAIAMSFIHPVYTKVWIGQNEDVIVGDFDNSLFTHSMHSNLNNQCLLSDTIINLFTNVPEGANLVKQGKDYILSIETDSYTFVSQFTPAYEDDEDVGSYNSDIILEMMNHSDTDVLVVDPNSITKTLSQAQLLNPDSEAVIKLELNGSDLILKDNNVNCIVSCKGSVSTPYEIIFKLSALKSVISNYSDIEKLSIHPMIQEDEVVGCIFWSDELDTVLAAKE